MSNIVSLFPQHELAEGMLIGLDENGDMVFRTFGKLDNRTAIWILECVKLSILTGEYSEGDADYGRTSRASAGIPRKRATGHVRGRGRCPLRIGEGGIH
jgi:hypothetical protein